MPSAKRCGGVQIAHQDESARKSGRPSQPPCSKRCRRCTRSCTPFLGQMPGLLRKCMPMAHLPMSRFPQLQALGQMAAGPGPTTELQQQQQPE